MKIFRVLRKFIYRCLTAHYISPVNIRAIGCLQIGQMTDLIQIIKNFFCHLKLSPLYFNALFGSQKTFGLYALQL